MKRRNCKAFHLLIALIALAMLSGCGRSPQAAGVDQSQTGAESGVDSSTGNDDTNPEEVDSAQTEEQIVTPQDHSDASDMETSDMQTSDKEGSDAPNLDASTPAKSDLDAALQGLVDAQVEKQDILGMAMAVRSADGSITGAGSGISDSAGENAWTVDTQSALGSVTKSFTAVLIAQLIEEGKLSLDDTLDTWFPEQPNADKVTIRMLLSHTSGLANYISAENVMDRMWVAEWAPLDLIAEAHKAGFVDEPGSSDAHYANTNYIYLGLIVEEITGNSWAQEIQSRITDPLDLEDTTFLSAQGVWDGTMVEGYTRTPDGYISSSEMPSYPHPSTTWSAGDVVSTVSDLLTFASALFDGDLISKETLAVMAQPVATDVDTGILWGLGGGTLPSLPPGGFGMGGDIPGYHAFFMGFLDTNLAVAALVNTEEGNVMQPSLAAMEYLISPQSDVRGLSTTEGNDYHDPAGRFTLPLVGDWTQVETDGAFGHARLDEPPVELYIVSVESDDMGDGVEAALQQVRINPAALTETDTGKFGKWDITYASLADSVVDSSAGEQGVTILAQVADGTIYTLIVTGDYELTRNPSDNLVRTVGGFALSGEADLPATVEEFEAYVNDVVGEIPPAISIAIALGEDVIYANGFGVADGPRAMEAKAETLFQWGSIAKIATATAIMQLVDQGLVNLDAPVSDYLDYFPAEVPITVRQLLNHSAGIPEPDGFTVTHVRLGDDPLPDPDVADREIYEGFGGPMFEPGSTAAYSNIHYVTLGQIVAQVSGQPYIDYVHEHILSPLGMQNTGFAYGSEATIANAAASAIPAAEAEGFIAAVDEFRDDGADFIRETDGQLAWLNHFDVLAAHGGMSGPATELIRFVQMHLNGGELDGVRVLSPESVALMQEMQLSNTGDPLGYGLGWELFKNDGHPFIEHPGGGEGLQALTRIYLNEEFALALMSNATGYDYIGVADAAENVVFSMLGVNDGQADDDESKPATAMTAPITDAKGNEIPGSVSAIETVNLGGFDQTITLRGTDTSNPVLLFLHGGPGVPSSPWVTWDDHQAELEEHFVVVHWDQRGAGKSFSDELTPEDMHLEDFVSDVLELTDLLREHFEQEKIFLWGHSWGSGLGFETLQVDASPYHAYIASAVRPDWNSSQVIGYEQALLQARQANDVEAVHALEALEPFDPTNLEHMAVRNDVLNRYSMQDFHTEGLGDAYLDYVLSGQSPEYPADAVERTMTGIEFTRQTILLDLLQSGYDLSEDFPSSPIPVHFFVGRHDYETPGELSEAYYDVLQAPAKSFTWFEDSAHNVMYDEPDKTNQEVIRIANEVLNP